MRAADADRKPGLSAAEVKARRAAEVRRETRRLPMALMILWTVWGSVAALLAVSTLGVQTMRHRRGR